MEELIRIVIYISIFLGFFTLAFYLLGFLETKKRQGLPTKLPFVTIIIPAYNEEDVLKKTVDSVLALNYPKDKYEILIVNDGSKDATPKIADKLAKEYSPLIKSYHKTNGGKASAMNLGIKNARGEIVVSFDSDSMVDKDALIRMLPYFADPKVMCVTPAMKVYRPRGILQRIQSIEYDLGVFLRKAFSKINAIHVTPGPFSAYRKIFFKKHGGYDENNITEDMEVAMRIQSLNYRIENSPHSLVYTIAPNEFYPLLRQRRRWYFGMIRNLYAYKFMFGKKYGELGLFIFPMAIISTLMTMGVTTYYIIKAIVDNLKQLELYSLIGFDFLHNTRFEWYLFQYNLFRLLSDNIFIFGIFFLFITLSTLLLLNRKINSPDKPASTFISYACFMVFYGVLFTFWWIVSIIYSITKKEISW